MTKNCCKASMGADIPLSRSTEFEGLNGIDRSFLEYGASMAAACCNVVYAAEDVEIDGTAYFHGVIAMSAAAMQARATLDAAEAIAASIDRLTAVAGAIARRLAQVDMPLSGRGSDAGMARPEPPHAPVAE